MFNFPSHLGAYLIIGTINTAVGNAIFWLIYHLFGDNIGFIASSIISFFLSVIFSFITQSMFVFRAHDHILRRLLRFIASQLLNFGIFTAAIYVMASHLGTEEHASYLLGSLLVIAIGFQLNQSWVFAR